MRFLIFFILFSVQLSFAQEKTSLPIKMMLDEWATSTDSSLIYSNVVIDFSEFESQYNSDGVPVITAYFQQRYPELINSDNLIELPRSIELNNVEADSLILNGFSIRDLSINNSHFISLLEIDKSKFYRLGVWNSQGKTKFITRNTIGTFGFFDNCDFESFYLSNNIISEFSIRGSYQYLAIERNISSIYREFIESSSEDLYILDRDLYLLKKMPGRLNYDRSGFFDIPIDWGDSTEIMFNQTIIDGDIGALMLASNAISNAIHMGGRYNSIDIANNVVPYINIPKSMTFSSIEITENRFLVGLGFERRLNESIYYIDWQDIANKYVIWNNDYFYHPAHPSILASKSAFNEVNRFLRSNINSYRNEGLIEEANEAYVLFKKYEADYLSYKYDKDGNFEIYIKLMLSKILGFYVDYGTNPAKAIIISIYIIMLFALFYLFFPSDWDVASKSKLLRDFRDFLDKNDKGYIKPFFRMMVGFMLSLLNAMALSINSFVTLGFGSIPTTGIARYVCILQGFIGWFLLSIFTVALINQIMI